MTEQFANLAQSTLTAPISASQTTITVANASTFPLLGVFRIVVQSFDSVTGIAISAPEIMKVTGVAGNSFTVQRAAESSAIYPARAFSAGAQVTHILTAAVMQALSTGGSGTVTSVSVVPANGFAGSVTSSTTTPAITLSTSVTGILKGDGTAISAASAGTDYSNLAFKTIAVSGQSDVVADSAADTLTLAAGSNVTITTNAGTDTITIAASGSGGVAIGDTITSGTPGSILYVGTGPVLAQDNANFSYDPSSDRLTVNGGITMLYQNIYPLQRTIPTTVGNEVDIGSFTLTDGTGNFEIWLSVPSGGYSQSKRYFLPASYNGTNNTWQTILPISTTGPYNGSEDTDLEINSNNFVTSFRLRRVGGSVAGTANIILLQQGVQTDIFTPSTSTGSATAPTAIYNNTLLTQIGGKVGVNIENPRSTLHTHLSTGATATNNSLLISTYSRPATSGVKYGNSMDLLLGSYGTSINSQSKMDFKLADGATNDPDTIVLTLNGNGNVTIPALTASQAVFTDGSKNLVSNAITGTGNVVMSTSATLVTPALGTPTALIGTNITGTASGLTAGNVTTNANLTGPITSVGNATSIASQTGTGTTFVMSASPTLTGAAVAAKITANVVIDANNAITASGNAATVPVTNKLNTVTNNSAATLTITLTTASAVDGQMAIVRILDFSAVAQTIAWVNTENSTVSAPTTSNGSTTLFLTVGFIYNGGTSKWRCIASA